MKYYTVTRRYADSKLKREVIATGLTLEEAQEHCKDPDTSSKTCSDEAGMARTEFRGPWFDGYDEE